MRVSAAYTALSRAEWALARVAGGEGALAGKYRHPAVAPYLRALQRQFPQIEALSHPQVGQPGGITPSRGSTGTSTTHVSGYFSPVPVLSTTTCSCSPIQPLSRSSRAAAKHAAPSGQTHAPSAAARCRARRGSPRR